MSTERKPAFLIAAEATAKEYGVSETEVLESDASNQRESSYPTPDCLRPHELDRTVDSGKEALPPNRVSHVDACPSCGALVRASSSVDTHVIEDLRLLAGLAGARGSVVGLRSLREPLLGVAARVSAQETLILGLRLASWSRTRRKNMFARAVARITGEHRAPPMYEAELYHQAAQAIRLSLLMREPSVESHDFRNLATAIEVVETYKPEEGAALRRKLDSRIEEEKLAMAASG